MSRQGRGKRGREELILQRTGFGVFSFYLITLIVANTLTHSLTLCNDSAQYYMQYKVLQERVAKVNDGNGRLWAMNF